MVVHGEARAAQETTGQDSCVLRGFQCSLFLPCPHCCYSSVHFTCGLATNKLKCLDVIFVTSHQKTFKDDFHLVYTLGCVENSKKKFESS